MPRFYFNFLGGDENGRDDLGCEFDSLEGAYVDAYQSMVRIGAELLLEQKDPSAQRINITDESGTLLMSLPFDEVFQRRTPRAPIDRAVSLIAIQLDRSRQLGNDIREACDQARDTVAAARATLGRVEAQRLKAEQDR